MITLNQNIDRATLERLGWPTQLIDDYQQIRNDLSPKHGTEADPNGKITSNNSKLYIKTDAPTAIWFNKIDGRKTGWVKIV